MFLYCTTAEPLHNGHLGDGGKWPVCREGWPLGRGVRRHLYFRGGGGGVRFLFLQNVYFSIINCSYHNQDKTGTKRKQRPTPDVWYGSRLVTFYNTACTVRQTLINCSLLRGHFGSLTVF